MITFNVEHKSQTNVKMAAFLFNYDIFSADGAVAVRMRFESALKSGSILL